MIATATATSPSTTAKIASIVSESNSGVVSLAPNAGCYGSPTAPAPTRKLKVAKRLLYLQSFVGIEVFNFG